MLLLRHTESGIDIDIILSGLPFEAEAVSRATAAAAELPDLPQEFERLLTQRRSRSPSTSRSPRAADKKDRGKRKGSKR